MDDFDRIKANVQLMADRQAPETEIDGYLQTEGLTPELFRAKATANTPRDFGHPALNTIAGLMDTVVQPMETLGQMGTDMMTLNKLDEITALPGAAYDALTTDQSFGDAYGKRLASQEARAQALEERNPTAATVGKVAGVVANPGAKVGAQFINKGATTLGRMGRSLVPAVPAATVAGAEGDTMGDRAENAAWSGAAAIPLAPAAQFGGELLGKFVSALFRGKQTLPAVPQGKVHDLLKSAVTTQPGPTKVAAADMDAGVQRLFKALKDDGVDTQRLIQMAQAGQLDDRTIAGLAGPNTRQMIDTYASMNGPAKTIVAGAQTAAEQGQSQNIMKAAGKSLGVKQSYTDLDDVMQAAKGEAGPFYDEFYAISPDRLDTPFMQNFLKNPLSKELLSSARLLNQIEKASGKTPDDVFQYLLDAEGNVSTKQTLNPRAADYVKRALDNKVQEYIDPLTGKIKGGVGRAWDELRRSYLADVKKAAPEYARALDAFSGPASMQDSMKVGRDILKDDWIANRKIIEEMTKSEKEAAKVGLFQAFDDLLSGISNKADKAKRLADIDKYLERAWPLFDSKKSFDAFKKSITEQTAEFQAVQMAGKGSQTAPRAFDALDQGIDTAATGVRALAGDKGSLLEGGKNLLRWISAPNANVRAAAVSTSLGKLQDVLPYLSAINRPNQGMAGTLLSGTTALPASQAKEEAEALLRRFQ
jgi:peptidoglycan hydrolase-like protein with peptidoglycan-binding domain